MFFSKTDNSVENKIVSLPISIIVPNPAQPRLFFDEYSLDRLAASIRQNGVLQPLTVRNDGEHYQLVAGERRLRAAKLAGLEYVPCLVIKADEKESAVLAILENIQRSDLNFLEEAVSIKNLIQYYGLTQEETAIRLGVAQSTIANKLRLLKLSDRDKNLVLSHGLSERQARALLRLPEERREEAIKKIYEKQLNALETDKLIDAMLEERQKPVIIAKPARSTRIYINTINKTIDAMKQAGIQCDLTKQKTEDYVTYTVKIPLR